LNGLTTLKYVLASNCKLVIVGGLAESLHINIAWADEVESASV